MIVRVNVTLQSGRQYILDRRPEQIEFRDGSWSFGATALFDPEELYSVSFEPGYDESEEDDIEEIKDILADARARAKVTATHIEDAEEVVRRIYRKRARK